MHRCNSSVSTDQTSRERDLEVAANKREYLKPLLDKVRKEMDVVRKFLENPAHWKTDMIDEVGNGPYRGTFFIGMQLPSWLEVNLGYVWLITFGLNLSLFSFYCHSFIAAQL